MVSPSLSLVYADPLFGCLGGPQGGGNIPCLSGMLVVLSLMSHGLLGQRLAMSHVLWVAHDAILVPSGLCTF